ncbi:similar to Saccharomyces cerevisiae YMR316W DIA1 Protein of unknown function, involved in invasive and pseudohyphal growth [Maudiozyma saulgeensis]|uniref:Uncharacterized protein n=1 Tax=Maudiozyma saulgeensis TaxID=1789683 RepID=A0A1X7R707_9SACH|nr:similar to Saccharomyces cerevisiae YMR316W DIA1 Protein of unknown function, involved in invasive and pseudohyphal growth [Kazachstania saulgeensis]
MGLVTKLKKTVLKDDRLRIEKTTAKNIPDFLHFSSERHLPIAQISGDTSRVIFPSVQSYDVFKTFKKLDPSFLKDNNGVGIPLFRIRSVEWNQRNFKEMNKELVYQIFSYELRSVDEVPPYMDGEVVLNVKDVKLYKCLYCDVYKANSSGGTTYFLEFKDDSLGEIPMIHRFQYRDMDTNLYNWNFRWHVKFSPIIENDHYKLGYLNPDTVSLLDTKEIVKDKKLLKIPKTERFKLIFGHYTSEDSDFFPSSIIKVADFTIGEKEVVPSLGVRDVPVVTKIFACQCLLIHIIELEKRSGERAINAPYNTPFIMM